MMSARRFCLAILALTAGLGYGSESQRVEASDVLKSANIDAMLARAQESLNVIVKTNYALILRTNFAKTSPWQTHAEADEFWFVRRGTAKVALREFNLTLGVTASGPQYDVAAGDVVSVPRNMAYQITPGAGRFEYAVIRIFPAARHAQSDAGPRTPRPMPTVATKSQIESTIAGADKNVLLHSAGALIINQVIYNHAPGPHEVHCTCDDIYFVRLGTAAARIDGTLVNAQEVSPGEIRGTDVTGAREHTAAPGDIVIVPRNTAHFMDPGPAKFSYLLAKVCD